MIIDSMHVVPGSFFLYNDSGQLLPDNSYQLHYPTAVLHFNKKLEGSNVKAMYRVISVKLTVPYSNKDLAVIQEMQGVVAVKLIRSPGLSTRKIVL